MQHPKAHLKLEVPLRNSFRKNLHQRIYRISFSVDLTFALVVLISRRIRDPLKQPCLLIDLASATIRQINKIKHLECFVFSKTQDSQIFRMRIERHRITIDLLEIEENLELRFVESVAEYAPSAAKMNKAFAKPLERGFLINYCLDENPDTLIKNRELVFVKNSNQIQRLSGADLVCLRYWRVNKITFRFSSLYCILSGTKHASNLEIFNSRKSKSGFPRLKSVHASSVLQSDRFIVTMEQPGKLKLINSRTGKHANQTQIRLSDATRRKRTELLGEVTCNFLYMPSRSQIYKVDLGSGTPTLVGRFTPSARLPDQVFGRFSIRFVKNRFLVVKEKEPLGQEFTANFEFHQKSRALAALKPSGLRIELGPAGCSGLQSMCSDQSSETLSLLCSACQSVGNRPASLSPELTLSVIDGSFSIKRRVSIDTSANSNRFGLKYTCVLVTLHLASRTLKHQLIHLPVELTLLGLTGEYVVCRFKASITKHFRSLNSIAESVYKSETLKLLDSMHSSFYGILRIKKKLRELPTPIHSGAKPEQGPALEREARQTAKQGRRLLSVLWFLFST